MTPPALNLWRWPDGISGKHFWQKEIPSHAPQWISRWRYPEAGSKEAHTYIIADRVATMAWIANQAVIDLHPWTSTTEQYCPECQTGGELLPLREE
jgi:bifunctional non-homologous end joining protein LigD